MRRTPTQTAVDSTRQGIVVRENGNLLQTDAPFPSKKIGKETTNVIRNGRFIETPAPMPSQTRK